MKPRVNNQDPSIFLRGKKNKTTLCHNLGESGKKNRIFLDPFLDLPLNWMCSVHQVMEIHSWVFLHIPADK